MDRNFADVVSVQYGRVALRKESVDRNFLVGVIYIMKCLSLSARRAWIEIRIYELLSLYRRGRSPQGERG